MGQAMNEIVPFPTEPTSRALTTSQPSPAASASQISPRIKETLTLIAQTAEKLRDLSGAKDAAETRAEAAFDQLRRDRSEWQTIWENIRRETASCQQKLSATETELAEVRSELQTLWRHSGEMEAREAAAIARAEAAEGRARVAEEWLSRLQDAVVAEFTTIVERAAS